MSAFSTPSGVSERSCASPLLAAASPPAPSAVLRLDALFLSSSASSSSSSPAAAAAMAPLRTPAARRSLLDSDADLGVLSALLRSPIKRPRARRAALNSFSSSSSSSSPPHDATPSIVRVRAPRRACARAVARRLFADAADNAAVARAVDDLERDLAHRRAAQFRDRWAFDLALERPVDGDSPWVYSRIA